MGSFSFGRRRCGGGWYQTPCRRLVGLTRELSASAFPRSRVPLLLGRSDAVALVRSSRRRTRSECGQGQSPPRREALLPWPPVPRVVPGASSRHQPDCFCGACQSFPPPWFVIPSELLCPRAPGVGKRETRFPPTTVRSQPRGEWGGTWTEREG